MSRLEKKITAQLTREHVENDEDIVFATPAEQLRRATFLHALSEDPLAHHTDEELLDVLTRWNGGLFLAATELGVRTKVLKQRIEKSQFITDILEDLDGQFSDRAEFNVKQGLLSGDRDYTKFYLTTKAKDRNYSVRTEVTGSNGSAVQVEHKVKPDLSTVSLESLREIAARVLPANEKTIDAEFKVHK